MLVDKAPIYLANFAVDMRKAINGLMLLAEKHFKSSVMDGAYYVFCNRKLDKIKILYWDSNGFALWYKRLEQSRYKLQYDTKQTISLTTQQLQWLLSGLDYKKTKGHKVEKYDILN